MQRSRWRRYGQATALALVVLLGAQWSGSAAEGPWPGLPKHTGFGNAWGGAAQTGMAETAKAKQWVRVPFQTAAVWVTTAARNFPPEDPRKDAIDSANYVYLIAPPGSKQNYGLSAPFTVRTVAFGAVPVAATVQLVQERDSSDLPVPLLLTQSTESYRDRPSAETYNTDAHVSGQLSVRVTGLTVDGVDLDLRGACQTFAPGTLALRGAGFWRQTPGVDEDRLWLSGNFVAARGGLLSGTVDIARFSGCTTATGDDISRLLTAAVSGPGNRVDLNVSAPNCGTLAPGGVVIPPAPGQSTPEAAHCDLNMMPPDLPYPPRAP